MLFLFLYSQTRFGFQWHCCVLNMKIGKSVHFEWRCKLIPSLLLHLWNEVRMKFWSQIQLKTFSWPNLKLGSHLNLVCTIYDDWVWRFWAFQLSQMNGVTQFITTRPRFCCYLISSITTPCSYTRNTAKETNKKWAIGFS